MDKYDLMLYIVIPLLYVTAGWFLNTAFHVEFNQAKSYSLISNQTLDEDINDIHREVNSFYKYNLSNVDRKLTDEQLKQEGGVCWHYAQYYKKKLKALGYTTDTLVMPTAKGQAHEVTWVSAPGEYCILDQTSVKCKYLEVVNGFNK